MSRGTAGARRPRVLLASGPVGSVLPRQAAVALAQGFAPRADAAVIGLAEGGVALGATLTDPGGELELLHSGWVARRDDLLVLGVADEPAPAPLTGGTGALGRLLCYALAGGAPQRVVLDLTGATGHDAGQGFLAELGDTERAVLAGCELTAVVAPGEQHDQLLGLRGVTSRRGRAAAVSAERMLAVDAALERFTATLDPALARADGAGAAGGLGFAVLALGGRLASGAALGADLGGIDRAVAAADLVVTACDSFDFGTRGGGVVAELAARCEASEVPLVVVSPVVEVSGREMRTFGVESAHPLPPALGTAAALTATACRLAEGWYPSGPR
ncbi:glycerate kinase [Micropruina sp.]|uniref:glycerate kinase n=1 Tax=Micropruina sp. TaxID=2737536 RepID=UPI0039E4A375